MGALVGAGDVAAHLARALRRRRRVEGERGRRVVPRLGLEAGAVDGPPVEARWGAGLEAPHPERKGAELLGEGVGGGIAGPPPLVAAEPDVDPPAEEGAGGEDDRGGPEREAHRGHHPGRPEALGPVLEEEVVDGLLEEREAGLGLERAPDRHPVALPVDLRPGRAHGRAAARVQGAEVDPAAVRGAPHGAAEGVDLAHEVPLADPPDRGVAAHLAEGLDALGEEQGAGAGAGGGKGRLGPRVPAPDHDDVECLVVVHRRPAAGAARPLSRRRPPPPSRCRPPPGSRST